MSGEIKVLIADDHPLFRDGLRHLIERDGMFNVIAEAADGVEAVRLIQEFHPNVAILDIDMPGKNGLEIVRAFQQSNIPVEFIFLTMYKEEDMFDEAMELGVRGYVLKESAATDILQGVRSVAAGKYFISPTISEYLVRRRDREQSLLKQKPSLHDLTPTERQVLTLVADNKTSKDIAIELHVTSKTIENHRMNIANKLNLHGSHALLKFAIENKSSL